MQNSKKDYTTETDVMDELDFSRFVFKMSFGRISYRKVSNISGTLVGNNIVDHSDVVGAAPTTSSFSTYHMALMDWAKTTSRRDERPLCFGIGCVLY